MIYQKQSYRARQNSSQIYECRNATVFKKKKPAYEYVIAHKVYDNKLTRVFLQMQ